MRVPGYGCLETEARPRASWSAWTGSSPPSGPRFWSSSGAGSPPCPTTRIRNMVSDGRSGQCLTPARCCYSTMGAPDSSESSQALAQDLLLSRLFLVYTSISNFYSRESFWKGEALGYRGIWLSIHEEGDDGGMVTFQLHGCDVKPGGERMYCEGASRHDPPCHSAIFMRKPGQHGNPDYQCAKKLCRAI